MDPFAALSLIPGIVPYLPWIVAAAAVAGAVIPHPAAPTGWYAVLYAVIHRMAMNFGKAANKAGS